MPAKKLTTMSMNHVAAALIIAFAMLLCRATISRAAEPGVEEPRISAADRDHWSFQPLERPELPQVKNESWPRNAIDRFILAKLEARSLSPMPEADRLTLLRRVTFDLTGLPPTPDEIEAFLKEESKDAYEKVVDRLLASHTYGERWAQHWLDVARFAETDGFEHDKTRDQAWKYRDWLINALNADLPFDEFVTLQLAGDEVRPGDADAVIATGFLLAGPDMPDINSQLERRHVKLNEIASTVGQVFLGLTMGCAQCHDHKFDPISQADFYRLRAVFEPAIPMLKRDKPIGTVVNEAAANGPRQAHLYLRGEWDKPGPQIDPGFVRVVNRASVKITTAPSRAKTTGRRTAFAEWLTRPDHPLTTRVIVNRLFQHHFGRGLAATPGDFGFMGDWPTHPDLLDWLATELPRQGWSLKKMHKLMVMSATYRLASKPLAGEVAADAAPAPLPLREGLGEGRASDNPQRTGKQDERQDSNTIWKTLTEEDPRNRYFGRFNRRRLEGEAIRDAMLAAADRLSDRRGGPGVMPPLPKEVAATLLNKNHWKVSEDEADHRRRSVYLFVRRNLRFPIFKVFDKPDANATCARRARSTTAPQALFVLNSEFSLQRARDLAGLILRDEAQDTRQRIHAIYLRTLGRPPSPRESQLAQDFLIDQTTRLSASHRKANELALPTGYDVDDQNAYAAAALVDFCLAMFNVNEFVYVD